MQDKIKTLLESYGLDKKETTTYLTLVEKEELNAYQIAKHTGIHRSTVYAVLERLLQKGFISEIQKEDKTFYSPLEISQIISKVKEKETILLSLIPELERLREEGISKVRVLESQKQFNYNLFDQITKGNLKELYIISGGPTNLEEEELSSKIFLEKLLKELKKTKIEYKGIWNEKFKDTKLLKLFSKLGENKFLKNLPTQATTVIFGEYIAYLFTINNQSQVIEIQNKYISEENKAYFSYLWKQAKN